MLSNGKRIWFPAKRYGWGWGLPCAWQGWVVMVGWIALVCTGAVFLMPDHPGLFVVVNVVLVAALIILCLLKGEKPRWRWGNTRP
jgi:uncharacterized membrane protein YhaH (DUF805 family)